MPYVIDQPNCSCCHRCRTACPVQAIAFKNAKYWIDPDKCIACETCAEVCHNGCVSDAGAPALKAAPHEKLVKACDVCVVGGGGSGLVAAAKAVDSGLRVVLLEKAHETGGCAWYASGFRTHYSKQHQETGLPDRREQLFEKFMAKTGGRVDPKLLKRMFEANADFADWMVDSHGYLEDYAFGSGTIGAAFRPKFTYEYASHRIDRTIGPGEGGWRIATRLTRDIKNRGGEILCKTAGKKLLTDGTGAVRGVLAEDAGGEIEIRCKAVVLATGAFTRNRAIMDKMQPLFYDDAGKEPVHIFTVPGCTGDGITMSEALGADIDYVNRRVNLFGPMRHPYPMASLAVGMDGSGAHFGSRGNVLPGFTGMHEISDLVFDPGRYAWKVVDTAIAEEAIARESAAPPQSPGMDLGVFMKNWREVFAEEEEAGAIVSAPTLEALAEKLGFDRAAFMRAIEDYNASTRQPRPAPDPADFDEDDMMAFMMMNRPAPLPVEKGPFYALKLKLFHENAVGGMTIDENASVLRKGEPIPGLYACGDTTRGIMIPGDVGVGFVEGVFTALTQAYNEGYIAGAEASKYAAGK